MRAAASVLSLSVLVPLTSLQAQVQPSIEPGARVRITAPEFGLSRQAATFEGVGNDVLVAVTDSTIRLPLASVERLGVHTGRHGHPWRGAGIGFGIGAPLGAAVLAAEWETEVTTGEAAFVGAVVGGSAGAVVGLIAGLVVRTDKWEEVPLDNLRVSVAPQRDGRFGVGLSVAF